MTRSYTQDTHREAHTDKHTLDTHLKYFIQVDGSIVTGIIHIVNVSFNGRFHRKRFERRHDFIVGRHFVSGVVVAIAIAGVPDCVAVVVGIVGFLMISLVLLLQLLLLT